MSRIISKIVFIAVVVWAAAKLMDIRATYPYMTNLEMVKEYWYYVAAIGVSMSQILTKDPK